MAKLLCFALLLLIVTVKGCQSKGDVQDVEEGSLSSERLPHEPLVRTRRQDEVDIITRGRDGRVVNEVDIVTSRRRTNDDDLLGRRRTETVRRVTERRPTTRRTGIREIDIIEGGRSGVREIDIVTGDRRTGRREIDIITGDRRTGTREVDIIRRGTSGLREIDIIEGGRTGTREIDIIERRRGTRTQTDRRTTSVPASRGGVEEDARGIEDFKPMPYKFQYSAPNHKSIVERMEEADAEGTVRGFYTIEMGNGLYRYVDYIADRHGYRAAIRSNEPGLGVGAQGPPADTTFELEKPPENLKEIDLPDRSDEDITEIRRTDDRRTGSRRTDTSRTTTRTETREVRRPTTEIVERRTTERRRGTSGVRLIPISEAERDRRERVIIEEEIVEEPRRTVIVEEERPETVVIEEVIDEPRTVVVEERRTEERRSSRDRPRIITS